VSKLHVSEEHEFEPEYGLPEYLPRDERLLWQGSPDWVTLAIRAFHVRKLAVYFGLLLLMRGGFALSDGASVASALASVITLLPLAMLAVGLLCVVAWLSARTAVYTITSKRVVMRIGVVLSVTFNLPFKVIESAAMKQFANGCGDIPLSLAGEDRIAYLHLWPHARPWRINKPEPMMRAVPDAAKVAALLSRSLAQSSVAPASDAAPSLRNAGNSTNAGVHHELATA
jgi:hypothetical protein